MGKTGDERTTEVVSLRVRAVTGEQGQNDSDRGAKILNRGSHGKPCVFNRIERAEIDTARLLYAGNNSDLSLGFVAGRNNIYRCPFVERAIRQWKRRE